MPETKTGLPRVGAAVMVDDLARMPDLKAFVVDEDRDVEIQDFTRVRVMSGDWKDTVAAARRQLDGHRGRCGIHGPFWNVPIDAKDPDIVAVVQKRFRDAVDACAEIASADRAPHLVVHSPFSTWDWHNADSLPKKRERRITRIVELMGPIVRRAEENGITLVIENIEDKDPMDRITLARAFDSAAVKVSLDTGHAYYAHRATGGFPVDYHVRLAGQDIAHIHLQDADGFADRHWRLGQGGVPWASVFAAIRETGTNPRLIIEMRKTKDILPSARWLADQGLAC